MAPGTEIDVNGVETRGEWKNGERIKAPTVKGGALGPLRSVEANEY